MNLQSPTLHERILKMTDLELEELAESEALAMADSSRLEGLTLHQDKIRKELLAGYRAIRSLQSILPDLRE
jgi:hypothetical protein